MNAEGGCVDVAVSRELSARDSGRVATPAKSQALRGTGRESGRRARLRPGTSPRAPALQVPAGRHFVSFERWFSPSAGSELAAHPWSPSRGTCTKSCSRVRVYACCGCGWLCAPQFGTPNIQGLALDYRRASGKKCRRQGIWRGRIWILRNEPGGHRPPSPVRRFFEDGGVCVCARAGLCGRLREPRAWLQRVAGTLPCGADPPGTCAEAPGAGGRTRAGSGLSGSECSCCLYQPCRARKL